MKLRTVNDYVDVIKDKFPMLSKEEVKKILTYCWKMIYLYNSLGNDVLIKNDDLVFFIGKLTKNSLKNFHVYKNKLCRRIRFMFKRKHCPWDGYYYFARTNKLFEDYLKLSKTKRNITFENVKLYRLLDECKLYENNNCHIFRLNDVTTNKFIRFYYTLITDKAEYILERDPLNIQDLMVTYNKYNYIE